MTFIQTPVIDNGNVHLIQFLKGNPQRLDGALECRRVSLVKGKATFAQKSTPLVGLFFSSFRQGTIHPAGKLYKNKMYRASEELSFASLHLTRFGRAAAALTRFSLFQVLSP